MIQHTIFDVIVIGAGPSGAATAFFLAKQGFNVLVVDKFKFPRDKICGDALLPRALNIIDKMGILPEVKNFGFKVKNLSVIVGEEKITETIPNDGVFFDFSVVIPRYILDELLLKTAQKAGATFKAEIHAEKIELNSSNVSLFAKTPLGFCEIKARLIVVATGANTALLTRSKIIKKQKNLSLAIRTYYRKPDGFGEDLEFYFSDISLPGYAWVFPTSFDTANVGLGILPRWWSKNQPSPKNSFNSLISKNKSFIAKLNYSEILSPMKSFPLLTNFGSLPTHTERVVMVGEAAGLVNPLTGDGIDWALESGYLAAQVIPDLLKSLKDYSFYSNELYEHFNARFKQAELVRDVFLNDLLFLRFFKLGAKELEFRKTLVDLALFQSKTNDILSSRWLLRLLTP